MNEILLGVNDKMIYNNHTSSSIISSIFTFTFKTSIALFSERENITMRLYDQLKAKIAEDPGSFVVVIGAGASMPSGLPSWNKLKETLCDIIYEIYTDEEEQIKHIESINDAQDLWGSFDRIKRRIGTERYIREIKKILDCSNRDIPKLYKQIWKLNVSGIINFNVDKFAINAYSEVKKQAADYATGKEPHKYMNFLTSADKFVFYPHGIISDSDSWVFTSGERSLLYNNSDFRTIISSLLNGKNLIIIGFNATEWSFQDLLVRCGICGRISGNDNYYFCPNATQDTIFELQEKGIFVIPYTPSSEKHEEINAFFDDFISFQSVDSAPPSIYTGKRYSEEDIPDDNECYKLSIHQLRNILNGVVANTIPSDCTPTETQLFALETFYNTYITQLHRAWLVDPRKEDTSFIYGYQTKSYIGNGAFGSVFEAVDANGNRYALKVLLQEVKDKMSYLSCFRRGIRSMKILTEKGIKGMVKIHDSFEIPACLVMDYVDGITLRQAIDNRFVSTLGARLYIICEVAEIIHSAHQLEERILHRDIKPENVMIENAYCADDFLDPSEYPSVKVLDFDLSWHRGATEKTISFGNTSQGFMAPEQIDTSQDRSLSRSTSVDVYSIGMLTFYVLTGKNPMPNQSQFANFSCDTESLLKKYYSHSNWKCLPSYLSDTIIMSTYATPTDRIPLDTFIQRIKIAQDMQLNRSLPCTNPLVLIEIAYRLGGVVVPDQSSFGRMVTIDYNPLPKRITLSTHSERSIIILSIVIERFASNSDRRGSLSKYFKSSAEKAISHSNSRLYIKTETDINFSSVSISREVRLPENVDLSFISEISSDIQMLSQYLSME